MLQVLLMVWCVSSPILQNVLIADSWAADGWVEKEVETIDLNDYFSTTTVSNVFTHGLFVEVISDSNSIWKVVAGDGHRVVALQDGYSTRKLDIETEWVSILQSPSRDFALISSWDNDIKTYIRYNIETGESYTLEGRSEIPGNLFGESNQEMSNTGSIFFIDPDGFIGSFSEPEGLVEVQCSETSNQTSIFNSNLSSNGELYVTLSSEIREQTRVSAYSITSGLIWSTNLQIGYLCDLAVSENGDYIAINKANGIELIDGRTGHHLSSFLPDNLIFSMKISPNGEYIAASVISSENQNSMSPICFSTNTSDGETTYENNAEPAGRGSIFISDVANDGTFLVEFFRSSNNQEMQYYLISNEGHIIWNSKIIHSTDGYPGRFSEKITLSSLSQVNGGYLIGFTSTDDLNVSFIQITTN